MCGALDSHLAWLRNRLRRLPTTPHLTAMTRCQRMVLTLGVFALIAAGCTGPSPTGACVTVGCPVSLQTAPPPHPDGACPAARLGGWLTADPTFGLGLRDEPQGGPVYGVIWPNGWSARRDTSGIVLIDRGGDIVAREGDRIVMAGDMSYGRINRPCDVPLLRVED